jgi:hypothetical protein
MASHLVRVLAQADEKTLVGALDAIECGTDKDLRVLVESLQAIVAQFDLDHFEMEFCRAFTDAQSAYWKWNEENWQLAQKMATRKELRRASSKLRALQTFLLDPRFANSVELAQKQLLNAPGRSHYDVLKASAFDSVADTRKVLDGLHLLVERAIEIGGQVLHDNRPDKDIVRARMEKFWNDAGPRLQQRQTIAPAQARSDLAAAVLNLIDPVSNPLPE